MKKVTSAGKVTTVISMDGFDGISGEGFLDNKMTGP